MTHDQLCERKLGCSEGAHGGRAAAKGMVGQRWFCAAHLPAARAAATKRKDRGLGACSVPGCSRPAAEAGGKCVEHRAGERAAGAPVQLVERVAGKGGHPYAPKPAEIYLVAFDDVGLLKVGKATPWTLRRRVNAAAAKVVLRETDTGLERAIRGNRRAWAIRPFGDDPVLWAVAERVEHAAAGRLAHNVGCGSVDHTKGKEWLAHRRMGGVDWPAEFHRAVVEALVFLGSLDPAVTEPRVVDGWAQPGGTITVSVRNSCVGAPPGRENACQLMLRNESLETNDVLDRVITIHVRCPDDEDEALPAKVELSSGSEVFQLQPEAQPVHPDENQPRAVPPSVPPDSWLLGLAHAELLAGQQWDCRRPACEPAYRPLPRVD